MKQMSSEKSRTPIERNKTELSLAIQLKDAYTGEPLSIRRSFLEATGQRNALHEPAISVSGFDTAPVVNPSGFFLFFRDDFSGEPDSVEINVTGGDRYADAQEQIDLSEHDPQNAVIVDLRPLPSYRFSAGATLLRGHVFVVEEGASVGEEIDPGKFGEENVTLTLVIVDTDDESENLGGSTETVMRGEFALFVTRMPNENESAQLRVKHDAHETVSIPIEVREGQTGSWHVKYEADEWAYRKGGEEEWTRLNL